MSALTSLLVRDHVVSVRQIEEAIQRQVIEGGALDTVLLEMGIVSENVVAAYCAAQYDVLPATRDEIMGVPRDTVRQVPDALARKYGIVPLRGVDDGTLIVARESPLPPEMQHSLERRLGVRLVVRVVPEVRMAAALHHHYSTEMSARMRRLSNRLRERDPGVVPYVKPPRQAERPAPDLGDSDFPEMIVDRIDDALGTAVTGQGRSDLDDDSWGTPSRSPSVRPDPVRVLRTSTMPPPPKKRGARSTGVTDALMRRLRGPLVPKTANELFDEAQTRDDVVEVLFAFAKQFFDYTALFVVHGEAAEGRRAFGSGASTEAVRRMAVPLDVPGAFASAVETNAPRGPDVVGAELDRLTMRDLGRNDRQPSLLVPFAVRGRVVLLVYGDRGGEPVGMFDVPELMAAVPKVASSFERVIVQRKMSGYAAPDTGSERESLKVRPPLRPSARPAPGPWKRADPSGAGTAKRSVLGLPGADVAPDPERHPRESSAPAALPRPSSAPRPEALEVLGVPRDAPPVPADAGVAEAPRGGARPRTRTLETPAFGTALDRERPAPEPVPAPAEPSPPSTPPTPAFGTSLVEVAAEPAEEAPAVVVGRAPVSVVGDVAPDDGDERPARDTDPSIAPPDPPLEREDAEIVDDEPTSPGAPPHAPGESGLRVTSRTTDPDGSPEGAAGRLTSPDGTDLEPAEEAPATPARIATAGAYHVSSPRTEVVAVRAAPARRDVDPRRRMLEEGHAVAGVVMPGAAPKAVAPAPEAKPSSDPPKRAISTAPPPTPAQEQPSIIVDFGESVEAVVRDLMAHGPDDEDGAVQRVLELGEIALPVLTQHFPGPLWFDRSQPYVRLPRGRDVSAIARALVAFHDMAVPYVACLFDQPDDDTRFYATLLAGEFSHPDLVAPLGRRIFDYDPETRALALEVLRPLRRYVEDWEIVMSGVRAAAKVPRKDSELRIVAIRALGALRDERSLPILLEILGAGVEELIGPSHTAAVTLTQQDFGRDVEAWRRWLSEHRGRHRVEWLIDALGHDREERRSAAAAELADVTQQQLGYYPGMGAGERRAVQRKYRDWWRREGTRRFGVTAS